MLYQDPLPGHGHSRGHGIGKPAGRATYVNWPQAQTSRNQSSREESVGWVGDSSGVYRHARPIPCYLYITSHITAHSCLSRSSKCISTGRAAKSQGSAWPLYSTTIASRASKLAVLVDKTGAGAGANAGRRCCEGEACANWWAGVGA